MISRQTHPRRLRYQYRSGMALLLVIPAVALSAVLAYAVLANTGTQDQITQNAALLAQTDCLAESGVNYAMYNLQNPLYAPAYIGTFWPGTGSNSISLAGSSGTVQITVTNYGAGEYKINSIATAALPSYISRKMTATVQLTVPAVPANQAGGFNGIVSLGPTAILKVLGDLNSNSTVLLNVLSSILSGSINQNVSTSSVPSLPNSLNTYVLNGITYSAKTLSTSPVAGTVLGPTATNPAGIYYFTGTALSLNGVTVNGTLYAPSATVTITGSTANTITAASDFPALIANKISVTAASKQLTTNGIVWAKTGITGTGLGSSITVNGSLLVPTTPAIATSFSGTINLNYVAKYVNVPNFSPTVQTPTSIKVVSWGQ